MGKRCEVPKETDILYAVVSSMTKYAKDYKKDIDMIGNSLRYAADFPAEFISLLIENYENFEEGYNKFLLSIPEYYDLSKKLGRVRNGNV